MDDLGSLEIVEMHHDVRLPDGMRNKDLLSMELFVFSDIFPSRSLTPCRTIIRDHIACEPGHSYVAPQAMKHPKSRITRRAKDFSTAQSLSSTGGNDTTTPRTPSCYLYI